MSPIDGTNTYGRSGFFMHGGRYSGSAGCIDIGGGLHGSYHTNILKEDILMNQDGLVYIYVGF